MDLLNYGAASQNYSGYHTDDLAGKNLTDVQKAWGTMNDSDQNLAALVKAMMKYGNSAYAYANS